MSQSAVSRSSHATPGTLRRSVRLLGRLLGEILVEEVGRDLLVLVETVRRETRALRAHDDPARRAALLARLRGLDLDRREQVARAFTCYFMLVNTAEQVHRVRRRRWYRRHRLPQPGSPEAWAQAVRASGLDGDAVREALENAFVEVVLTAHPTEARRRTVLNAQRHLADDLMAWLDAAHVDPARQPVLRLHLKETIRGLWHTRFVRVRPISVLDEVEQGIEYLVACIAPALPDVRETWRATLTQLGVKAHDLVPIRIGSWIGGDRDGHPGVTAEVTTETLRRMEAAARKLYAAWLQDLLPRLAWRADELGPERLALLEDRFQHQEEPLRSFAAAILQRLEHPATAGGYTSTEELLGDLARLAQAWDPSGQHVPADLRRLLDAVTAHGLTLAALDIREHAARVRQAVLELDVSPQDRSPVARDTWATVQALADAHARYGTRASTRYILSMVDQAEDLRAAHALLRQAGLSGRVDIVPLFETGHALAAAGGIMQAIWRDPSYRDHLAQRGNRQWIMLGYSDSGKDAGYLAAAWAIYEAQESLLALAQAEGIGLAFFHGRGGAVGRGGGPTRRAVAALPAGSTRFGVCFTVQGEMLGEEFLTPALSERSLEQYLVAVSGALVHAPVADTPVHRTSARELARRAEDAYRALVHATPNLMAYVEAASPLLELGKLHLGSRPTRRSGSAAFQDLRAIPWVFSWTQSRVLLPAWYGVGTALEGFVATHGPEGLLTLRDMFGTWAWFRATLDNVEMALAKADLGIARLYADLVPDRDLARTVFHALETEYRRTVEWVLRVSEHDTLLAADPVLRNSIALRNPYVDPLNYLQIIALEELRAEPTDAARQEALQSLALLSIQGVAQGLRNTG